MQTLTRQLPIFKHKIKQPVSDIITITYPGESKKSPIKDHEAGLTKFNSVTISESCLPELPAGRYHYSMFDLLDVLTLDPLQTRQGLQERLFKSGQDHTTLAKDYDNLQESNGNAIELVSAWMGELEGIDKHTPKAELLKVIKRLECLREDSMFEY